MPISVAITMLKALVIARFDMNTSTMGFKASSYNPDECRNVTGCDCRAGKVLPVADFRSCLSHPEATSHTEGTSIFAHNPFKKNNKIGLVNINK